MDSSTEKMVRRNTRRSDEEENAGNAPSARHVDSNDHSSDERPHSPYFRKTLVPTPAGLGRFRDRFLRKGKRKIGTMESLKNIAFSSWRNVFIVFIPIAWVAHFLNKRNQKGPFTDSATFVLSLLAIVPLERLFDYGGEQMAFYCGKDLGDLIVVTLNNAVEATLAIILLTKCELKLLQSTIIGVVILHLLLVPGTAFITGGARIMHQDLHPHLTELNHTLLTMGVLAVLLPAAFFAALDRGEASLPSNTEAYIVNDTTRTKFLQFSRGIAIILLLVYVASRIFLHNPPGDDNAARPQPNAPMALLHEEQYLMHSDPEVSQWVCIAMLVVTIALMAATAEWLVDSIEIVREDGHIQEEWFGLILLPVVSFAADGILAIGNFILYIARHVLGLRAPPSTLAKARAIDLSIQFTLFWTPFIVLLGWWTNRPMSLLFDLYEVCVLLGSSFLVNYVTADSKTNWAEGFAMVAFYLMIAVTTWFYTGQVEIRELLQAAKCAGVE